MKPSKKKLYYKLVRDRIPEIIDGHGCRYAIRQIRGKDLRGYAFKKLREEVQEFVENPCAEEAADILEILDFICTKEKITPESIASEKISKRITKGGFDMGFFLEWTEE